MITVVKKILLISILFIFFVQAKTFNQIEFLGDVDTIAGEFDRTTLLKVCHIDYPALYKFWKKKPTFEKEDVDEFKTSLIHYANSMGYYNAEVMVKFEGDTIFLSLVKNNPIKIASIEINEGLREYSLLEKGKRFRSIDFTETKQAIVNFLEQNGYPSHKMKAKAYVNLELYQVDINISVNQGTQRFFSETTLKNETKIDNELIEQELNYQEGDLYNILKLEESYENIYQLGVFETIDFNVDLNETSQSVPIAITLTEGKTKEFTSNIGYDTEDGIRAGVGYIDYNFLGNLRQFKIGTQVSQRGHKFFKTLYDPKVNFSVLGDMNIRNEVELSRWDYDAYVEKLLIERLTFGKKLFGLEHYFGFQLEDSEILSGVPDFLAGDYFISSLFYRLLIDKRDSKIDAKEGYYTSLYLEKAMGILGSEIDYLKTLFEARYIHSFDKMVLASKMKIGTISNQTPPFKHFFVGGAMSNRGYEYRDLGEHVSDYPIGGISMLELSLEARYYLTSKFSMIGFVESSKLSNEVYDFSDKWYNSYGLGIRYLSIIGPLRMDIGFPQEGGFALHLGIGQVF
jgi:translocation and assembly module TamA